MNPKLQSVFRTLARPLFGRLAPALRSAIVPETSETLIKNLRQRLSSNPEGLTELEALVATYNQTLNEGQLWPHVQKYNAAIATLLGHACAAPATFFTAPGLLTIGWCVA